MSLVPQPGELVDPRAVADRCDRIDIWAAESDDVNALHGALAGLSAIDIYLDRTGTEGRARVNASMRRIEVRIGKLLGPTPDPRETGARKGSGATEPLSKDERSEFRKLAAHPEVVERVIAEDEGDGDRPASRARVLHEIRKESAPAPEPRAPTPARAPREPDPHDIACRLFETLMAFNAECEHLGDDLENIIAAGMDESVMPSLEVRTWIAQIPRAQKHLDVLARAALDLRNLRSAK